MTGCPTNECLLVTASVFGIRLIRSPRFPAPALHRVQGMRLFFPGPDGDAASRRLFDPIRSCGVSAIGVPGNDKPMSVYVCLPIGAGRRCLSCLLAVLPFLVPRAHAIKENDSIKIDLYHNLAN